MKLRLKVQRHLVAAWVDGDSGDWIFTLCRSGFGKLIGQQLKPGEEWLVEVTGHPIEKLNQGDQTMANWHLAYGLNGKSKGDKKLNINLTTNKNSLHLTMGGGIPEGIVPMETVFGLVEKHLSGLDDLDAEDPANHVKTLEGIAGYCTELAGLLK